MRKPTHMQAIPKITHQLFRLVEERMLSLDLVSEIAGDKECSQAEREQFKTLKERYGGRLFTELLFTLTHQYFPPEISEELWNTIIRHKHDISDMLGRNVGVVVAALDYLSNIKNQLEKPTLISKIRIATIAELAVKDGLTELFDHVTFYKQLDVEIIRHKRYNTEVSIMMIDIDDFKICNDRYGHQTGDRILVEIAAILQKTSRKLDLCARYGGEEFAMILPQTDYQRAYRLGERLRKLVAQHFAHSSHVTISAGIATCPTHAKSTKALIRKADKALYHAKKMGKNQIAVFQP